MISLNSAVLPIATIFCEAFSILVTNSVVTEPERDVAVDVVASAPSTVGDPSERKSPRPFRLRDTGALGAAVNSQKCPVKYEVTPSGNMSDASPSAAVTPISDWLESSMTTGRYPAVVPTGKRILPP